MAVAFAHYPIVWVGLRQYIAFFEYICFVCCAGTGCILKYIFQKSILACSKLVGVDLVGIYVLFVDVICKVKVIRCSMSSVVCA